MTGGVIPVRGNKPNRAQRRCRVHDNLDNDSDLSHAVVCSGIADTAEIQGCMLEAESRVEIAQH